MENSYTDCIVPPEPIDGPVDGGFIRPQDRSEKNEGRPKDIFAYGKFGRLLAEIVRKWQTPPLVLALTGGWGSGKSVFAKQWAGELRKKWAEDGDKRDPKDAPVIYFDAFANDHQDNALLALAGEVMKFVGRRKGATAKAKESAKQIAKGVGFVMAEGAARYATHGLVGLAGISCAMESAMEKRMKEAEQGREAIRDFREALEKAAKELGDGQPLVFIVDELDRCRPDFALELLEKIKHLFSVPNVCFLVVANLEQLGKVVEHAYGYDAKAAQVYLDKFFHRVFQLPQVQSKAHLYIEHFLQSYTLPYHDRENIVRGMLTELAILHSLELRDIERIFTVVALVGASANDDELYAKCQGVFAVGLCVMRHVKPALYEKAANGSLSWEDADKFMHFSEWKGSAYHRHADKCKNMWAGALKKPEELDDIEKGYSVLSSDFMKVPQFIEELDSGRL